MASGLQHFDESFLRDVDGAKRFHPLFAFFLLLEQLALACDVAAVAFGGDVLAKSADSLAGDHFAADGSLNGDLILLARNHLFELGGQRTSPALRFVTVDDAGESVD